MKRLHGGMAGGEGASSSLCHAPGFHHPAIPAEKNRKKGSLVRQSLILEMRLQE